MNKHKLKYKYELSEKIQIGIDEVGRGPMLGRVYTAAVILPDNFDFDFNFDFDLLKDSKKFTSHKKLLEVSKYIKEHSLFWNVSYVDEKEIDKINILNATHKSMHQNIYNLFQSNINLKFDNTILLIDGNNFKSYNYMCKKDNIMKQLDFELIEGGDNKYCSIAAASILAKVERDDYIKELCNSFKKLNLYYNIEKNKGYGTKQHIDGIKKFGISPWHRTTFGICKTSVINSEDYYL
jgi:ribonuclease HII